MFGGLKKRRAQSTAEFAALFALVVAAVVAMQIYVRRGLQAKQRDAVVYFMRDVLNMDPANDEFQYVPYYETSNITSTQYQNETTKLSSGFKSEYSAYMNITYDAGSYERQEGWNKTYLTPDKI